MKFSVIGLGYVGLSNALLLGRRHSVVGYDISWSRVQCLQNQHSYLEDEEIIESLHTENPRLNFTTDLQKTVDFADYIIIAVPTDYNDKRGDFDTGLVEQVIEDVLNIKKDAVILIKSTVSVGFVDKVRKKHKTKNIIFVPEFLREGRALYDCLHPTRIIVGERSKRASMLGNIFKECSLEKEVEVLLAGSSEAEAIKLFANTYLAMRVSFFNELDTFAASKHLDAKEVITGIALDDRIGKYYNNPSFGYGGYCLPKDAKALKASYSNIPQEIIGAITRSNELRKKYIEDEICSKNSRVIGIYRLTMKKDSDNFKNSALVDIMRSLKRKGKRIVIYEPLLEIDHFEGIKVVNDLMAFKAESDVILANRYDMYLDDVLTKVYTRDAFHTE
ncbi:nucleotide sugar dehydrogenase [Lactococcus muris]|uniref:UDP-glucose 6-dehydrogenase n=1 Tax=Lactococcus muris TaxID=2941330 RepID=A0ABV4DCJ1_9LACT